MKRIFSILTMAMAMMTMACNGQDAKANSNGEDSAKADSATELTILFAGDLMQHEAQIKAAMQADGTYSYEGVFDYVKPKIEQADLAIANFEVTLGGKPYKGYPQFCAPDEYLDAAVKAGFDVLVTANNHSVDTYGRGINRTITLMDSIGIPHLGTYRNAKEREQLYPFLIERNGITIALLNFTYGTNGLKVPAPYIVNLENREEILRDIKKAKAMHPDVIIAIPHWGIEYVQQPNKQQRELAQWMLDNGVDHVIGGHPHVIQPFEVVDNKGKKSLVVYSLGNYISNMTRPNTDGGAMVTMKLRKENGKTSLVDTGYSLVWTSRPALSGKKQFRLYPADYPADSLNATERVKRQKFLDDNRRLLQQFNKEVGEIEN